MLPLNEPVEIDGKFVCLKAGPGGAELEAVLLRAYTPEDLQRALNQGFSSAIVFDAGLGQTSDGKDLVLSQWLAGARNWRDAAQALEKLLNQLDGWQAVLNPASVVDESQSRRQEERHAQRLRRLIAGEK